MPAAPLGDPLTDRPNSEWDDVLLGAAREMKAGRAEEARLALSHFIETTRDGLARREALAMRGTISTQLGDLDRAEQDLSLALETTPAGTYSRYVIELGLAQVSERRSDATRAARWYRAAIGTLLGGERFSGSVALEGLIRTVGLTGLDSKDEELLRLGCRHSWTVMRLEGDPPSDFSVAISVIGRAERPSERA